MRIQRLARGVLTSFFFAVLLSIQPVFADSLGSVTGGQAGTQSNLSGCVNQSPTLAAGQQAALSCGADGTLKVNASVSASIAGFPTIQTTGTPIAATTGGVTGTLPAGAVVVASNVGATNGAYCKLGASATVSDQLIPPNSWFAFTVGANTQLTCITSTSTTTVNMVGGSGLPTGSGGGGGGSGGGGNVNITQVNGNTALAGAGATGTGSLRVTAAQDTTTIAGSAPGTAGTPSTNVVSVQGVSGGTAQPVSGTVAATQSGTWNITNVSGTVSLPTGAATSALQPTNAAQGSTTSGQTGHLVMGAVTTAAPTYTTTQTSPLSLDTAGNLRVNVIAGGGTGGTSVAQGSTTAGQNVSPMGCRTLTSAPTDTTAQTNMPSCDTAGALRVNVTTATGVAQASTTSGQTVSPIGCRTLTSAPTDTTAQTNMPWCTTAGSLTVQEVPGTAGGLSTYDGPSAAVVTNTAVAAKASAGQLYGWAIGGTGNSAACYMQVFDLATGSVTLGTTAPKLSVAIPAGSGSNQNFASGIAFATAITVAATTTRTGSTACTVGLDVNLLYK